MNALRNTQRHPADERECGLPPVVQIDFNDKIRLSIDLLTSIRHEADDVEIAGCVECAVACFRTQLRHLRASAVLSARQRDALLNGLVAAHQGVELHVVSGVQARILDGIRAFQMLATHFAKPAGCRTLPPDDVSDLVGVLTLGQHAASEIVILAQIDERADQRGGHSLDVGEGQ